jgi:hypothetical protein
VAEPDASTVAEPDASTVAEPDASTVAESDASTVAEPYASTVAEPDASTVAESYASTVAESYASTVAEPDARTVAEPDASTVAEPYASTVAEPYARTARVLLSRSVSQTPRSDLMWTQFTASSTKAASRSAWVVTSLQLTIYPSDHQAVARCPSRIAGPPVPYVPPPLIAAGLAQFSGSFPSSRPCTVYRSRRPTELAIARASEATSSASASTS